MSFIILLLYTVLVVMLVLYFRWVYRVCVSIFSTVVVFISTLLALSPVFFTVVISLC